MDSWSAVLALTGFQYSGITGELQFGDIEGKFFWSNGRSYGTVEILRKGEGRELILILLNGNIKVSHITIDGMGSVSLDELQILEDGVQGTYEIG